MLYGNVGKFQLGDIMESKVIHIEQRSSRYEPHVLEDTVDPIKNHKSDLWRAGVIITCFIEVVDLILFFATLNTNILFQIWIFNSLSFLLIIIFIVTPVLWFAVAGTQKRLDGNKEKLKFKYKVARGYERFSKYGEHVYTGRKMSFKYLKYLLSKILKVSSEKAIGNIIGIESFDFTTGISTHRINEKKWAIDDHPYLGQHSIDLVAYVNTTDDEEIIIENLFEVGKTLKEGGVLIRTCMYSGETIANNLNDIERKLANPDISEIEQKSLYSVYNHYHGREGNYEPIYCIHFGLPYTSSMEKALEYMRVIRDEYEYALNERGVETTLIKDSDIMKAILDGIFTGKMWFTGDICEN